MVKLLCITKAVSCSAIQLNSCASISVRTGAQLLLEANADSVADFIGWNKAECGSEIQCAIDAGEEALVAEFFTPMKEIAISTVGSVAYGYLLLNPVSWRSGAIGGSQGICEFTSKECSIRVPERLGDLRFQSTPLAPEWKGACSGAKGIYCTINTETVDDIVWAKMIGV